MEGVRAAAARDRDRLAALGSDLLAHHRPFDAVWRLGPGGDAAWRSYLEGLLRREDAAVLASTYRAADFVL